MRSTTVFGQKQQTKGDKTMADEQLEQWVVTRGVTEIFLVAARDAKDAEEATDKGQAVLIQRKTSSNAQPKPDTSTQQAVPQGTPVIQPGQGQGATHADLQNALARLRKVDAAKPSG
jgi:hypothetical protein